ncbi:hypothetical protein M422DRAFT_58949 [Sphaerobolus stellatus SS14]|nr:hypothetical protein M422DRAFT_58949 [Sphaerobolus stellatus SS14]
MSASNLKGKATETNFEDNEVLSGSENSNTGSASSDSTSDDEESDEEEEVTQEYLNSLLEKAKIAMASRREQKQKEMVVNLEEEVIILGDDEDAKPLPPLDPGPSLPKPYFKFGEGSKTSVLVHDVDVEAIEKAARSQPAPPPPPPELNKDNKPLTKRQRKELRKATAGPGWFDMPAPDEAELPKLYHEVEALRLRNALDPKRFYRKEEGEGKGIKGLPKYFTIGTIIPSSTPFGTTSNENLSRSERKRTIVDELVDDTEAKRYAKKKFMDLQGVRGERGRATLAKKKAARKPKW